MIAAVDQRYSDVDNRVAGDGAAFQRLFHARRTADMYSRGMTPPVVLSTNSKPDASLAGLDLQPDVAVLAAAAALANEAPLDAAG